MSNGLKVLLIAAAVIMTLGVIAIAMGLFSSGQEITKTTEKDLQGLSHTLSSKKYEAYNGTTVSGSSVINAIRMYGETGTIIVSVKTSLGTAQTYNSTNKYTITTPTDANYINPTASFASTLSVNANGVATQITFVQS